MTIQNSFNFFRLFNEVTDNVNQIISRQMQDEEKPRCTADNEGTVCGDGGESHCNIGFGICVECLKNDHCTTENPVCSVDGSCVPSGRRNLDFMNTYSPQTRNKECTQNTECPTLKPICEKDKCVECTSTENQCSKLNSGKPKCLENKCVECLKDGDCGDPRLGTCNDNNVCTKECTAHNQCVHPAKLRCNFARRQCEGGDFLAAFTLNALADTEIKKRMDNTEKGITNAQTSGASVAQIYGDIR